MQSARLHSTSRLFSMARLRCHLAVNNRFQYLDFALKFLWGPLCRPAGHEILAHHQQCFCDSESKFHPETEQWVIPRGFSTSVRKLYSIFSGRSDAFSPFALFQHFTQTQPVNRAQRRNCQINLNIYSCCQGYQGLHYPMQTGLPLKRHSFVSVKSHWRILLSLLEHAQIVVN